MWWKVAILLGVGLMYFGYVRTNTDRAMTAFESWKTSYLQTIDAAASGNLDAMPKLVEYQK